MTEKELKNDALHFRKAIEQARDDGKFKTDNILHKNRMNHFPYDCCDDTADLFTHYLYHTYGIDSIRVDGSYYDESLGYTCNHSWQEVSGMIVDLTGDQFNNDPALPIKANAVYVGLMDDFHRQFKVERSSHSCGIECLGDRSWDRMYASYDAIMYEWNKITC